MCAEILNEFNSLDLPDSRLNDRAGKLLVSLGAKPSMSINMATGKWSETMAAYRFLDNDRVAPQKIIQAHCQATVARMAEQPVVLLVQDTTELDFTQHPPADCGVLNEAYRFGFYDHTQAAFTPQGLCLGVTSVEFFNRTPESLKEKSQRKQKPIEQKESMRWLNGYRQACQLATQCPETHVISVADSEADIYDIFVEARQHPNPVDFVIRSTRVRRTDQRNAAAGETAYQKIADAVLDSDLRYQCEVELQPTPKRAARTAHLEVRAISLTLKPPHARSSLPSVEANLVRVTETGRPADDPTAIDWQLLTTLPIDSDDQVQQVIDNYRGRWPIEPFFRTYKTGCRVEEIQLETELRMQRALAIYKIIAWRVMYLTFLGRECPDIQCDAVFDDCQWKSVWQVIKKKAPPKRPPSLGKFIRVLATLGGYNNRRHDPPPGPEVIWTSIKRMADLSNAWLAFGPGKK